MSPPASATTRPARMPSRAARRASSSSCAAAIPGSWACRYSRRRSCSDALEIRVIEDILINVTPRETRVAIAAAGAVQELLIERTTSRGLVGNVYMGRVARVLPGMQSAFIEIGLERAAFLHIADIREHRRPGEAADQPIEKLLAEGEPVAV